MTPIIVEWALTPLLQSLSNKESYHLGKKIVMMNDHDDPFELIIMSSENERASIRAIIISIRGYSRLPAPMSGNANDDNPKSCVTFMALSNNDLIC